MRQNTVWRIIIVLCLLLTLSQTSLVFMSLQYKSFENTAGKGEIARNDVFLPIWKTSFHFHPIQNCRLQLPKQALVFTSLQYKSFENTAGKGEIARNKQFLHFLKCFLPISKTSFYFHQIKNCCLQTLSFWQSLKFVDWERVNSLPDNNILNWSKLKQKTI